MIIMYYEYMHKYTVYNNIAYNNNSYLSVILCVKDHCVFFTVSLLSVSPFLNSISNNNAALISVYTFIMI